MEFIKSFIIPSKMKKYRYMSIFIALAIFIASVYILITPYKITMTNQKQELIDGNVMELLAFYELDQASFDYNPIKTSGFKIEDNELKTTKVDDGEFDYYLISYQNEAEEDIRVHFVFDPYNNVNKKVSTIKDDYYEEYELDDNASEEDKLQASTIATLTYIAKVADNGLDVTGYFETLRSKTAEELQVLLDEVSRFDYFNISTSASVRDYLMVFNPTYLDYQIPLYDLEGEERPINQTSASILYSQDVTFDMTAYQNIDEFGNEITEIIMNIYIITIQGRYTINAILMVLLYPAMIILILWLFFRRNGNLKTFKEYYNIAAITSVVPTLVSFGLLWIFPEMISLYGILLSVFYIFVLYRINLTPQEV